MRRLLSALLLTITAPACAGADDAAPPPGSCEALGGRRNTFSFHTDALSSGDEAYLCFGFDASALAGQHVTRVTWAPPQGGGVTLHHATLYASRAPFPAGPTLCEEMPSDAVGLHIWAPGGDSLILPDRIALSIPPDTARLVVQAHLLRTSVAPAAAASVAICSTAAPPEHVAAWFSTVAPVPAIRPYHQETKSSRCRVDAPLQALSVWPHMHLLGREFHSAVEHVDGSAAPLADINEWDFSRQRTYPIDIAIEQGGIIDMACTWQNDGPDYVFPGPRTTDEMCTQGLIAWPEEAAHCSPL